jgi:DNA modification methylase
MPTLNWIGKEAVIEHHKHAPFRLLKCNEKLSTVEDSGNLLIQGDNLEALKALLPYYAEQVKCIYIDPPYNTGKQTWVYNDSVNSPEIRDWLGKVVGNDAEDLSRHDKWLCMMYPRLTLLHEILADDGVIFISIDDNEVFNLRILLNDIFGAKNFITQFVWNTEGHTDNQLQVKINHEYIIAYAKNINKLELGYVIDPSTREGSNLWKGFAENSITKNGKGNPPSEVELPIGFPCVSDSLNLDKSDLPDEYFESIKKTGYITRPISKQYKVAYPVRLNKMVCKDGILIKPCKVYSGWANVNKLKAFIKNDCQPIQDDDGSFLKFYLSERGVIYYKRERESARNILSVLRNMGTTEQMKSELEKMGIIFEYPKPKELIKYIIRVGSNSDDLILDSFAGSGTTGQAIIEVNEEDKTKRRFMLIEMDKNICENITAKRLKIVSEGKSGFRFCELGATLFDGDGQIREEVKYNDLAQHVYFIETGQPLPQNAKKHFPMLGVSRETAVYLLYNGILKDKSVNGGNVVTNDVLQSLPKHTGAKVIFGNGCRIGANRLRELNIVFKQIPYEIRES